MSFFLFEFDNASFYLEREKTQEELIRDRKLSELTNALFELLYWLTMCVMLFFLIQQEGNAELFDADGPLDDVL